MELRQVFGFALDPEYSEEEMTRMDAHRCIEEADLCDFNNALIRGFGMLLQGSKFVVAMQGSYSNKEMRFQYIPGWVELNFQDISGPVYHTNIDINKLTSTYLILCLIWHTSVEDKLEEPNLLR